MRGPPLLLRFHIRRWWDADCHVKRWDPCCGVRASCSPSNSWPEDVDPSLSSPFPKPFLAYMLHWSGFWSVLFTEGGGKEGSWEVTNKSTCMTHLLGLKISYPSSKEPLLFFEGIRCLFLFFQRRMDWKLYILDFFWATADIIKRHNGAFSLDYCQS